MHEVPYDATGETVFQTLCRDARRWRIRGTTLADAMDMNFEHRILGAS
jgi:hypothetical protein